MPGIGVVLRISVPKLGHPHNSEISNGVRRYSDQVMLSRLVSESLPSQSFKERRP